jgi:hypothetical protein
VIPVILDDAPFPALLQPRRWVDLGHGDETPAVRETMDFQSDLDRIKPSRNSSTRPTSRSMPSAGFLVESSGGAQPWTTVASSHQPASTERPARYSKATCSSG